MLNCDAVARDFEKKKVLKNLVFLRVRTTDCDTHCAFERFLAPLPAAGDRGIGGGRTPSTRALRNTVRTL